MSALRPSNVAREMEAYGFDSVVKSHCRMCHGGCGVLVYVKDGRVAKIAGDPDCPINHGTLCSKGIASTQLLYHPERLTHPVRRAGPRGSGRWERISWDEALDTIAERMLAYRAEFGAESVVLGYGTGRENEAAVYRFSNLFGSPNVLTAGHFCYGPRIATTIITCGSNPIADYDNFPKCIMVWGNNVAISNPDCYKGEPFSQALNAGATLIVVDPRLTRAAARADVWLQLRPGTDTALALGMAHVIVEEGLYERDFVEKHVHGWEAFAERTREYPLDRVERITGVPREKIAEAARLYATVKPGVIQWGVAIEQQVTCADNNRALLALMGITGNIDVPGGQVLFQTPNIRNVAAFGAHKALPKEQAAKRLGGDRFRLAGNFAIINPKYVWDAILTEEPYPVKLLFLISSNPLMTRANGRQIREALDKVGFLAVADFFLTPTAELADIVLPAATWLEMDYLGDFWKRHGWLLTRRKVVEIGECRSDHEMLNDLGRRVGQGEHWWPTFEGGLDHILEPLGVTWQQFKEQDRVRGEVRYRKYEERGFSTPTRKFELYSTLLEKWGYDPLPQFRENPESPESAPELLPEYPYTLITGARQPGFFHTENRQLPWMRELHRDPAIEIHPETAAKEGIRDGEWVVIETRRGRIRQRAKLTEGVRPNVVAAQHAWWFPEREDTGRGWDESNVNLLIDNAFENCDPAMGATSIRTLLCRIKPDVQRSACSVEPRTGLERGAQEARERSPRKDKGPEKNEQGVAAKPLSALVRNSSTGLSPTQNAERSTRYALRITQGLCWGCKSCEAACKQENGAPDGIQLIRVAEDGPRQIDGKWHFEFVPRRCLHCGEPACAPACPSGAIERREDGIVLLDEAACTGCGACVSACPFDAIAFDDSAGVARKCNLCHHRLDNGLLPACADNVCLAHCIHLEEHR